MAIHHGVGAEYATLVSAHLETPRVVRVTFVDGRKASFPVSVLPYATGASANAVRLVADGDLVEIEAPSGDFVVTADEFLGLATDSLGGRAEIAHEIGAKLRALREERGLSLRDVEALTGIAGPNLHALEAGKSIPRLDTIGRLADAYRTTIASLVSAS